MSKAKTGKGHQQRAGIQPEAAVSKAKPGKSGLNREVGSNRSVLKSLQANAATPTRTKQLPASDAESEADKFGGRIANDISLSNGRLSSGPLPPDIRKAGETHLGIDLAPVRLQSGTDAISRSHNLGALAFAEGNRISFGAGQLNRSTERGRSLIGHELTHFAQQQSTGIPKIQRWPGDPIEEDVNTRALKYLTGKAILSLRTHAHDQSDMTLVSSDMITAIEEGHGDEHSTQEIEAMIERAGMLGSITVEIGDESLDILTAIERLETFLGFPPELQVRSVSFGAAAFRRFLADGMANYIQRTFSGVLFPGGFGNAVQSWGDQRSLLHLELEGSLDELIRIREQFSHADTSVVDRQYLGPQISEIARRVLLVNQALSALEDDPSIEATPLDEALDRVSSRIDEIRNAENDETSTLRALGNERSWLSPQPVSTSDEYLLMQEHSERIAPEMAFPATSTEVTEDAVGDLAGRVRRERSQMAEARAEILPNTDDLSILDFKRIFDYWFSFFGVRGRNMNMFWQQADQLYGGMHHVAGMAHEMSVLHLMLMDLAEPSISMNIGHAQSDFSADVPVVRRRTRTTGTAESPSYNYAEMFHQRGGTLSAQGQQQSREAIVDSRRARTRSEDGIAAQRATASWQAGPRYRMGRFGAPTPIPRPVVPIHDNAWRYLITTENVPVMAVGEQNIQENKLIDPAVANYLMARMQHYATLERDHTPGYGDSRMAMRGVEYGIATGEQIYIEGEEGAVNPTVNANQGSIRNAEAEARDYDAQNARYRFRRPTDIRTRVTAGFVRELERSMSGFFTEHDDIGNRALAVMHISNREFGASSYFWQQLTPQAISEGFAIALGVQMFQKQMARLVSRSIARAMTRGISRIMTAVGGSDVSAALFLIMWARRVSNVNSFHSARVAAYFGKFGAHAMGQLLSSAITSTALKGFSGLAQMSGPPRTNLELANDLSPIIRDPAARETMLIEIRAEIDTVRANSQPGQTNPELQGLRSLEMHLMGQSVVDVPLAADVQLAHTPEITPRQQLEQAMEQVRIPDAQREQLRAQMERTDSPDSVREAGSREGAPSRDIADGGLMQGMPPDLHGIVATRSNRDGRGVRVHYETRMHFGIRVIDRIYVIADRNATADDIRLHANTMRRMKRYQGVSGMAAGLVGRITAIWGRVPAEAKEPGSLGFEAHAELLKLPDIINSRVRELDGLQNASREVRADAEAELQSLMAQLRRHQEVVNDLEAQVGRGVGYVAAQSGPRRNIEAMNEGYPDPSTAAPYHNYYSPRPGVFELRISASAPAKDAQGNPTPRYRIVHGANGPVIAPRPAGGRARSWSERRASFVGQYSSPRSDAPAVEAILSNLQASAGWSAADAALGRRWAGALQSIHAHDPSAVSRLLTDLGTNASSTRYDRFRRNIRAQIVQQVMRTPSGRLRTPAQQVAALRDFQSLGDMDPASMGRLFTAYRRARFELGSGNSRIRYVDELPDVTTQLPGGRMADSAIEITSSGRPQNAPPPGNYIVDDKAGARPYDPAQAQRYSQDLHNNGGSMVDGTGTPIRGPNGQPVRGLVYFFESSSAASAAKQSSGGLHPNIHFAYFDSSGALKWL